VTDAQMSREAQEHVRTHTWRADALFLSVKLHVVHTWCDLLAANSWARSHSLRVRVIWRSSRDTGTWQMFWKISICRRSNGGPMSRTLSRTCGPMIMPSNVSCALTYVAVLDFAVRRCHRALQRLQGSAWYTMGPSTRATNYYLLSLQIVVNRFP
jgi:hypothetical protein